MILWKKMLEKLSAIALLFLYFLSTKVGLDPRLYCIQKYLISDKLYFLNHTNLKPMNNIWQHLKKLPWPELFLVSFIATLTVLASEVLLILSYTYFLVIIKPLNMLLLSPIFGLLIPIVVGVGMGALAVYLLEWWQKKWLLNNSSLWALVLCLFIGLLLKSLFPLPSILVAASKASLISLAIGVFWKGRPYW